jgi:glycosyltransferase involved in cell wall biosynthesis
MPLTRYGRDIPTCNGKDAIDRTEEIAVSLGCRMVREDARNLSRIRNAGVSAATGEMIVTIDADSVILLGEPAEAGTPAFATV